MRSTTSEIAAAEWTKKGFQVKVRTANGEFDYTPQLFRIQKVYGGAYEFIAPITRMTG